MKLTLVFETFLFGIMDLVQSYGMFHVFAFGGFGQTYEYAGVRYDIQRWTVHHSTPIEIVRTYTTFSNFRTVSYI